MSVGEGVGWGGGGGRRVGGGVMWRNRGRAVAPPQLGAIVCHVVLYANIFFRLKVFFFFYKNLRSYSQTAT